MSLKLESASVGSEDDKFEKEKKKLGVWSKKEVSLPDLSRSRMTARGYVSCHYHNTTVGISVAIRVI